MGCLRCFCCAMTFHPIVCMNVLATIQKVVVSVVSSLDIYIIFAMNQICGCLHCIKALDIIRIKMVVSVVSAVHSIDIFFSEVKKIVVSVVSVPSRDFLLSCSEACPEIGLQCSRRDQIWLTCTREKLKKTKQKIRCYD